LRRQAISLRRYLSPQREAMARLLADTGGWLSEPDRLVIREAADRLQRLLEDIDLAREHATIAQEDLQSRLSDRLGRRMYVLAVITCLFLPLTFITGLFGVNLGGIPGAHHELGFATFFLLTLGFGLVLTLLLRWRHWL
jgi:zinc transporter